YLSPSGTPYSEFGASLAISGDTVVVGAPGGNVTSNTCGGAIFIFIRVGNIWNSQVRMTAPDIPACNASTRWDFGRSVALEGDTALVGAPLSQTSQAGAAYFFTRSGSAWTLQMKATPSDSQSGDQFGGAVAMNGDSAVIGAKRKSFGLNP